MKKGLSVLLIAAALFGFYGGAVSLNDVLACKDYWEEKSEQTTADLNKLEDGINQLQDNEEAYLDGQEQLADAAVQLADGENQIEDGRLELAQGEADYAAAPGKLAAARAKIAAGEQAISDGEDQLESLHTLIDGVEAAIGGFDSYLDSDSGYPALRSGRIGAIKKPSDTSALQYVLGVYAPTGDKGAIKAATSLQAAGEALAAQDANKFTNKQYDGFKDYLEKTKTALDDSSDFFDDVKSDLGTSAGKFQAALVDAQTKAVEYRTVLKAGEALKNAMSAEYSSIAEKLAAIRDAGIAFDDAQSEYGTVAEVTAALNEALANAQKIATDNEGVVSPAITAFIVPKSTDTAAKVSGALQGAMAGLTVTEDGKNSYGMDDTSAAVKTYLTYVGTIPVASESIISGIQNIQDTTLKDGKATADLWLNGYKKINALRFNSKSGLLYLSGGVAKIVSGVYDSGNDELISGMNKAAKAAGFSAKKFTPASSSQLTKDLQSGSWMENFYNDAKKVRKGFKSVLPALNKKAKEGAKTLAAGRKELAAGKALYAQGLADYKAAPSKLAAGRQALADGLAELMDGRKQFKAGQDKLAEYDDGEQQVRDGLATLVSTEPDGGLKSILERLEGDGDFDNGDSHLELAEGLIAVTHGREYQSDSGVLITEEVMGRMIGTVVGLVAGLLAVIAALLSFLKKHKGAAVFGILAAFTGGAGIAYYTSAGTEFSTIAGSTIENTAVTAFGVLIAAAVVFAIVHLMAKKEA